MLELKNIYKSYKQGGEVIQVLSGVNITIKDGERVAIVGASGSGKSTLLSIMSGMDKPDSGEVFINGKNLSTLSDSELSRLRNSEIAMIFQSFELVPSFSALENVMLPLDIASMSAKTEAESALTKVGLASRLTHLPSMLSGGEEQRVAIARALVRNPKILFADEPTGNLDSTTGAQVLSLIVAAGVGDERTLVIITHDKGIAQKMDRILEIKDGAVREFPQ